LVAVCYPLFFALDGIYVSTNAGATWNMTSAPSDPNTNLWTAVASSADGVKLVAVMGGGDGAIYTSANSGLTWHKTSAPIDDYDCVASSADGTKLVAACNYGNGIYISSDSGANWVNTYNGRQFGGQFWRSVGISADGSKMVAAEGEENLPGYPPYSCMLAYSTNSGVSWLVGNNVPGDELWWAVACSANGTVMVGAALHSYASSPIPGPIYISVDSGTNWTPTSSPMATWGCVACSADGTKLTAGVIDGGITSPVGVYSSIDSGAHWAQDTNIFGANSIAYSADGSRRVAADAYIYVSHSVLIPTLKIGRSGNDVLFYWATNQIGVHLEQKANISISNWSSMTNVPTITNGQSQVLVSPSNHQDFYRLASP
jgi:hypothetical protein